MYAYLKWISSQVFFSSHYKEKIDFPETEKNTVYSKQQL